MIFDRCPSINLHHVYETRGLEPREGLEPLSYNIGRDVRQLTKANMFNFARTSPNDESTQRALRSSGFRISMIRSGQAQFHHTFTIPRPCGWPHRQTFHSFTNNQPRAYGPSEGPSCTRSTQTDRTLIGPKKTYLACAEPTSKIKSCNP